MARPRYVCEFGGRLGIRVRRDLTVHLCADTIRVGSDMPSGTHGGFAVRWAL